MRRICLRLFLFSIVLIGTRGPLFASGFIYPVGHPLNGQGYVITQKYNTTDEEGFWFNEKHYYGHTGVDLANGSEGGLIRSSAAGRVAEVGNFGGWGNMVRIEHTLPSGDIVYSQYAHMRDAPLVSRDQEVCMGEPLGFVGSTGLSTGPHLHFEIKIFDDNGPGYVFDGSIDGYHNPLDFINGNLANQPPCKSLARIKNKPEVYWLQNGKAYHVISFDIINHMNTLSGWRSNDAIFEYAEDFLVILQPKIPEEQDTNIPEGSFKRVQDFISTGSKSNWLLIKLPNNPEIYLIENGKRRHITSSEVFNERWYEWDDIIIVTQAIFDLFEIGIPISSSIAHSGIIDFEEFRAVSLGGLGGNIEMKDFYAGIGVYFKGATSLSKSDGSLNWPEFPPRSGDALVYDTSGGIGEISIGFTVPVTSVGAYYTYNTPITLKAYDSNGTNIQTKDSSYDANYVSTGNPPNEYIELADSRGIKYLSIEDTGNTYTIDDIIIKNVLTETIPSLPQNFESKYQDLDVINQGESKFKSFYNQVVQTMKIIFGWKNSEFSVRVYSPDGILYAEHQSQFSPIIIDIPNAQIGKWLIEITAIELPNDNYPIALVIGVTENAEPPSITSQFPQSNAVIQDGVTFIAEATSSNGIAGVYFYLREPGDPNGLSIGYDELPGSLNDITNFWELYFDTIEIPDGNFVLLIKAIDTYGNEGWSEPISFSVRNWTVLKMLPSTKNNKAGRTMPVKFSLRIIEAVDPAMPFAYNEQLEIRIYNSLKPSNILQSALFDDSSTDYRIDTDSEHYITNFRTDKKLAEYIVEVWRQSNDFLVGSFTFKTVK